MKYFALLLLLTLFGSPLLTHAATGSVGQRLSGYIVLQVQQHGEAWYINPDDGLRYYMKDGIVAYEMMRSFGLGITNTDLATIPSVTQAGDVDAKISVCSTNALAGRLKGEILLQIQAHGEAWYVDPVSCYRVYMQNGDEAYRIMREISLGITDADLATIPEASVMTAAAKKTNTSTSYLVVSANNSVVVAGQTDTIVDQQKNVWTISNGVVKKNGSSAGYSSNVNKIAYVNNVVWQRNTSYLWWSWSGNSWSGGNGTGNSPLIASGNLTTVLASETANIVDTERASWKIVNGVVQRNNVAAGFSASVISIVYADNTVWHENSSHLWWYWNGTSWSGGSGIGTSPLAPVVVAPAPAPAPAPTPTSSSNPFAGKTIYKDNWSDAQEQAGSWGASRTSDAAKMQYLADQPTAVWFGDWYDNIEDAVDDYVDEAEAANKIPVLVAYNIPNRDCGDGYSAGGVNNATEYHNWIVGMANGIGSRQAIVIIEPDAMATDCFDDARGAMITDAVNVLEAKPNVSTYLDAGHPNWTPASTMATRLTKAGIANAQGFALNVSNFYSTSSNIEFGNDLSARVGGKHYIIDTGRNHNGWQGEWCNPQGAGIGLRPTTNTGVPLFDAGLWVKSAGGSDGNCNGGPDAGHWWPEYGLKLYDQGTH